MDVTQEILQRNSEEEFRQSLSTYVDSGTAVIHVRTGEVMRCLLALRRQALTGRNEYHEWDVVNGFRQFSLEDMTSITKKGDGNIDISSAFSEPMNAIDSYREERMRYYVFVNPHVFMESNPHMSHLVMHYASVLPATNICVVMVTPDIPLPGDVPVDLLSLTFDPPGLSELQDTLADVLDGVKEGFDGGAEMTEEDIERVCYVGAGMTAHSFETYASLAAIRAAREGKDTLTADDIIKGVTVGKTDVVNANDILELYPSTSIDNVGGMENLKSWVHKRAGCYSDKAKEFGVEPPKGMVLVGPPGCLSGDTVVEYRRGARNSGRSITLEEMYKKFNGLPTSSRPWDTSLPTYLHSLSPDGEVFYNRVISVIQAGVKPVVLVETDKGEIVLTANHPVAQPGGTFMAAGELRVGDTVLMRGSMRPTNNGGRRLDARPPRRVDNVKYHPYGARKEVDFYEYRRVAHARIVVEAHMNELGVDEYLHALRHNSALSSTFDFLPPDMEVHHVDEDTLNDDLSNLMVLHKAAHAKEHGKTENFNVEYVTSARVLAVCEAGSRMTYDVQMDLPANNFVANGFIVHNTGKSLVAKAVSSVLGVPLVRLDFGRVFNSLVGASEERMRVALHMVEKMAPVVIFCDEIDKGLGGIGGSGDSGVSSRVLGTFLTWLNDCKYPVFTIMTANNVTGLPPELLRRGRFDAIFSTSLPTPRERTEVLRIHLGLRGRDISTFDSEDTARVVSMLEGYVPAEIESAVKDALVDAFSDGVELEMSHIEKAAKAMVPLSVAFKAQIETMNEWAKNNATPVSRDDSETAAALQLNRRRVLNRSRSK